MQVVGLEQTEATYLHENQFELFLFTYKPMSEKLGRLKLVQEEPCEDDDCSQLANYREVPLVECSPEKTALLKEYYSGSEWQDSA